MKKWFALATAALVLGAAVVGGAMTQDSWRPAMARWLNQDAAAGAVGAEDGEEGSEVVACAMTDPLRRDAADCEGGDVAMLTDDTQAQALDDPYAVPLIEEGVPYHGRFTAGNALLMEAYEASDNYAQTCRDGFADKGLSVWSKQRYFDLPWVVQGALVSVQARLSNLSAQGVAPEPGFTSLRVYPQEDGLGDDALAVRESLREAGVITVTFRARKSGTHRLVLGMVACAAPERVFFELRASRQGATSSDRRHIPIQQLPDQEHMSSIEPGQVYASALSSYSQAPIEARFVALEPENLFRVRLQASHTYVIEVTSRYLVPEIRVVHLHAAEGALASDTEGGLNRNALLTFDPPGDGDYVVMVRKTEDRKDAAAPDGAGPTEVDSFQIRVKQLD